MPSHRARRPRLLALLAALVMGQAAAGRPALLAQGLDLKSLVGDWIRVESTYDPNDQMRILLAGSEAKLTRVPARVHAAFRVGLTLWADIGADGSVRVRGSDGNYYQGRLRLEGTDLLHVNVAMSTAGSVQVWRRAGPTIDGVWVRIAPGDPGWDGMQIQVVDDQATIKFLAGAAPRQFRVGTFLWRGIRGDGAVDVLGSDRRYHIATLKLETEDRLRLTREGVPGGELWVRPALVTVARTEAADSTATSSACVGSAVDAHAIGRPWGWSLDYSDNVTGTAASLGVLDYRGSAPGLGYIVTDLDRYSFAGMGQGFSFVWQQVRGRTSSAAHVDLTASEYTARNRSYREEGYRAADIEIYTTPQGLRYAGSWIPNPEGIDWHAAFGLTSDDFGRQFQQRRQMGFRLVDIEAYATSSGIRYAGIWHRSCDNSDWRELRGMTREGYQQRFDSLNALGFRVVDFESYRTPSGQRYAAIWEKVPGLAWAVRTDRNLTWFLNYHQRYTDQGYRLVDFESYETAEGTRYAGIWAEHDPRYRLAFRQALDDSVEAYRGRQRVPGISVAIIRNGDLIYRRGFGWADSARQKEAWSGTVYPTASVAKAFAGTLAARLEQRGLIDLTQPTRNYVDSLPSGATHTLEQLLAKTGCVVHYTEGPEPPETYYRWRADALRPIRDSMMLPSCTPGQRWHYSTHGFTLVGAALEAVTGKDIVQLIDEEIARPMGLRTLGLMDVYNPGTGTSGAAPTYWNTLPYTMDTTTTRGTLPSQVARYEDASWKVLGGGLQIDAPDLARFGWLTLDGRAVSDSVRDNRLWRVLTTGLMQWSDTTSNAVSTALGWEVRTTNVAPAGSPTDARRVAEHLGTATGGRAFLTVYRDDGLVVAVLSNQRQGPGTIRHPVQAVARTFAQIVLNSPPPPP